MSAKLPRSLVPALLFFWCYVGSEYVRIEYHSVSTVVKPRRELPETESIANYIIMEKHTQMKGWEEAIVTYRTHTYVN